MSGTTCNSCGHAVAVARTAADGTPCCPRCGDPLPGSHHATAEFVPGQREPNEATRPDIPSTVRPEAATLTGSPAAPQPRLPKFAGYEVLGIIGRGGMGVVYKAQQLAPRRTVALKLLLAGRADRFRAEVAAVARLQHPNVVQIHEVGDLDGRPYFSMEYVAGGSLAARLRSGPLRPQHAAQLVARLARAVQHAHDRGIIHRDLKPANILLRSADESELDGQPDATVAHELPTDSESDRTPFEPKIADFGLAKHLEGSSSDNGPLTQSGAILGTPSYMAPEQARGKVRDIGPAVDVYALGAVLYECLLGQPPFRESSQLDTLMKVMAEEPIAPRTLRPEIPRDLETICLKCLRKDPSQRYGSAQELADDLERFLGDRPIAARPRGAAERLGRWVRRRRTVLGVVAGLAMLAMLAIGLAAWWPRPSPPSAPVPPLAPATTSMPTDLRLVPPDAVAFISIRGAELWKNPALRDVIDALNDDRELVVTMEGIDNLLVEAISLRAANIERITVVVPAVTGRKEQLIIISTVQPYSVDQLGATLQRNSRYVIQEMNGKRFFIPANGDHDGCHLAYSDRILVIGDTERLERLAHTGEHPVGPLSPALERAAQSHTVAGGIQFTPEMAHELAHNLFSVDTHQNTVAQIRTASFVVDVSHPSWATQRVRVPVAAWVGFSSPEHAEAARPVLPTIVRFLAEAVTSNLEFLPQDLTMEWLEPACSAVWTREGSTLQASVQIERELPEVTGALQEQKASYQSRAKLLTIARALHRYHEQHGTFPPATVTNAEGQPLYSWRVLVLPYLGEEQLYRRFHLNRAWNHPSNRLLLELMPAVFEAPGTAPGTQTTPYQVLVGEGGLFDRPNGRGLSDVRDRLEETFLVVECARFVPWSQPDDPMVSSDRFPALGGVVRTGFNAAMLNQSTRFFSHERSTPELLRGCFTRSGKELLKFP